ncbi:MAG TPA: hypothetical protein VJ692_13150 [Nitrospiraceae bacterium]|nr:hypothetical protein [Nitrospiraceae bacterium]
MRRQTSSEYRHVIRCAAVDDIKVLGQPGGSVGSRCCSTYQDKLDVVFNKEPN